VFKGKYRGQKQLWYAMRFKGEDSEINLSTEKPEFVEWKWVKLKSITELVIPFKKAVYESIVEQFGWIVDSDVK
jgi:putative (di)nucleoside polyphosphate hydrolase